MKQLVEIVDTGEFEDDGFVRLLSASRSEDSLTLTIEVDTGEEGADRQAWKIGCHQVQEASLCTEHAYDLSVEAEHPLLWDYTEPWGEIHFRGRPSDSASLFEELWRTHRELTSGWIPFGRYFHVEELESRILSDALRAGVGLLARGPMPPLVAYEEVAERHGLSTSRLGFESPRGVYHPEDHSWRSAPEGLHVLLVGKSHVVAARFEVEAL